jgi:hypothetical protein
MSGREQKCAAADAGTLSCSFQNSGAGCSTAAVICKNTVFRGRAEKYRHALQFAARIYRQFLKGGKRFFRGNRNAKDTIYCMLL